MDFRDLKYFEAIATEGNLARAAERVHRTQPALTKCIDRLEESLGARLFEKDGRGMRLTAAGHVLLKRTRQMTLMVEETAREMQDHADGLRDEVRIGCLPTLAEHLMPSVFGQLLAEAPAISVTLTVAMNDNLLAALADPAPESTHLTTELGRWTRRPSSIEPGTTFSRKYRQMPHLASHSAFASHAGNVPHHRTAVPASQ